MQRYDTRSSFGVRNLSTVAAIKDKDEIVHITAKRSNERFKIDLTSYSSVKSGFKWYLQL